MGAERRVFLTRDQEPISPQGHSRDGPARHSARHQRGDGRQMVGGGVSERRRALRAGGDPGREERSLQHLSHGGCRRLRSSSSPVGTRGYISYDPWKSGPIDEILTNACVCFHILITLDVKCVYHFIRLSPSSKDNYLSELFRYHALPT